MLEERYKIIKKLGSGGMGEVYQVMDTQTGTHLALKTSSYKQIKNEFLTLSRLHHPNIITVYDFGSSKTQARNPQYFFTMEYIQGGDFYDLFKESLPTTGTQLKLLYTIILQICTALRFIHYNKLYHCDIKPSNILVHSTKGREIRSVLTDFGLIEKGASKKLKGTLHYIAPEVLKGNKIDQGADLFSLGVTIYQITTHHLPFNGDTALALIKQHTEGKITSPKEFNPEVPDKLNELILDLLRPKPQRKTRTVEEIQRAIYQISGKTTSTTVFTPTFTGREREFSILGTAIGDVRASKKGRVIMVWGENGTGKTRLLQEFKSFAQIEGAKVKFFDTADNLIKTYINKIQPELAEESELNLFEKITEMLIKESKNSLLVVIVEDLHTSKRTEIKLVEYLIRSIESEPIILLMTSQDKNVISSELQSVRYLRDINLKHLGLHDTARLVRSMILSDDRLKDVTALIQKYTAGNPFLTTTLTRNLVENGILRKTDGKWVLISDRLKAYPIPKDITEFVSSTLSGLSDDETKTLKVGSLLKNNFTMPILKELIEIEPNVINRLLKKGLIIENNPGKYSFTHDMVSKTLEEDMTPDERTSLHRKIADFLEKRFHKDINKIAPALTYHYLQAGEKVNAYRFALVSGERARAASADTEAVEFLELALSLADNGSKSEKLHIYINLGDLYRTQGKLHDALRNYESAIPLASHDYAKGIYRKIGMIHRDQQNFSKALDYFKKGLETSPQDAPEKALILSDMAWVYKSLGDHSKALSSTRGAIKLAESIGDKFSLCYGNSTLGSIYLQDGDYDKAARYYGKTLEIAREIKNEDLIRSTSYNLGQIFWKKGKPDKARKLYIKSLRIAEKKGNLSRVALYHKALGIIAEEQGNFDDAEKHYTSAIEIFKKEGDDKRLAELYLVMGHMYHELSDLGNALRYYKTALLISLRIKDEPLIVRIYSNLGNLYQEQGRLKEALKNLKKALEIKKKTADQKDIAFTLDNIGYVYMLHGKMGEASKFLHESFELSEKQGLKKGMAQVCPSLGEYYLRIGNIKEAEYYCLEGIRVCEEINDKLNLGITNRVLGSIYAKKGEIDKAIETYSKSIEILKGLKADYLLAKSLIAFGEQIFSLREKIGRKFWQEGLLEQALDRIRHAENIFKKMNATSDLQRANSLISNLEKFSPILLEPVPGQDKRLKTLYRMSQIVNSTMEINELLEKILDLTIEVMGAERGLILLREGEELKLKIARNMDKQSIEDMSDFSRTIVENVEKKGELIITANAQKESRFKGKQSIVKYKLLSILCVPFKIRNHVVGAVYIDDRRRKDAFTSEDLEFLQAFCDQAAIALENARLINDLKTANKLLELENVSMKDQISYLKTTAEERYSFGSLIGKSKQMQEVYNALEKIIKYDSSVIIEGETGTGKELIANIIHYKGPRKDKNFIIVNSSAIPEHLLESELFGHVKGAFTGATQDKPGLFELADGGSIFLDEIAELNPDLQAKLLRVLQDGELRRVGSTKIRNVNVRVIAATNCDLKKQLEHGRFREDLYYRLNVMSIKVPPLRERKDDVPLLATNILSKFRNKFKKNVMGFTSEALNIMRTYDWPGNVRELENVIESAIVMTDGKKITAQDLPKSLIQVMPEVGKEVALPCSFANIEKKAIIAALKATGGNKRKAVKILGISRPTLDNKIKRYSIRYM